jgi:hypothetical protein
MPIVDFHSFCQTKLEEKRLEQIKNDLEFGLKMEEELCPKFEEYFADTLTKTSQYHYSDWVGDSGTFYELKTRKDILPTTHATTIFPIYKCSIGEKSPLILLFHFEKNNQSFYIIYDKEKFSKYETSYVIAQRNKHISILHYEIPINDLILIDNTNKTKT